MTRKEAIKWFENRMESTPMPGARSVYAMALTALQEQEERRWIPVTERLPEFGERVICTDGDAVFEQYRVEPSCVYGMWDRFGLKSPMQEVTHWMPLPKPPKEGDITNGC